MLPVRSQKENERYIYIHIFCAWQCLYYFIVNTVWVRAFGLYSIKTFFFWGGMVISIM